MLQFLSRLNQISQNIGNEKDLINALLLVYYFDFLCTPLGFGHRPRSEFHFPLTMTYRFQSLKSYILMILCSQLILMVFFFEDKSLMMPTGEHILAIITLALENKKLQRDFQHEVLILCHLAFIHSLQVHFLLLISRLV